MADKARADEKEITFSSSRRRPSRSFCALASGDCERTTEKEGSGMAERTGEGDDAAKKLERRFPLPPRKFLITNGEQPGISETETMRCDGRLACVLVS